MSSGQPALFECIPNVAEGRDRDVIATCARAIESAGVRLAHQTCDAVHHRSVFTFFGEREAILAAALALAREVIRRIDLREHRGAHPRMGALDVLPFVPFGSATLDDAAALAREAGEQLWAECGLPSFFYGAAATRGERRLLADVRRGEFEGLALRTDGPDVGVGFHPSAGAVAIGARPSLVAFNVVLARGDIALARRIARLLRERSGGLGTLRAIGVSLEDGRVQVSCNVTDVAAVPLYRVVGLVRELAARAGATLERTELIGLVPRSALAAVAAHVLGVEAVGDALGVEALPGGAQ